MKVVFIIEDLTYGGKERRLVELLKGLAKEANFEAELIMLADGIDYEEVRNLRFPIHVIESKAKKDITMFSRLYRFLQKSKPAIIHSWGTMPSIYAIPASKMLGIKLINGNITNAPAKLTWFSKGYLWDRLSFPFADVIVGNSLAGLKVYRAPKSKTRCIHNGIDFNRIRALSDRQLVRDKFKVVTEFVIGMVARFTKVKDYGTYIEAALQIVRKRSDVSFMAVGDGPELEKFKAIVPAEYKDRILFTGHQNNVESIVNIFDISVLATYTEGISNAIIEYMLLHKPVVATDGGGTAELLQDGETGFLMPPKNPDVLATKLEYLLNHPEKAEEMGIKGRKRIEEHFSLDLMTKRYLNLYKELLGYEKQNVEVEPIDSYIK